MVGLYDEYVKYICYKMLNKDMLKTYVMKKVVLNMIQTCWG